MPRIPWFGLLRRLMIGPLFLMALAFSSHVVAEPEPQQETDLQAARACFEKNLDAIRQRDRAAYLSTYWQSESLARNGWGGVQLGYADHAANSSGDNWPDVFDAQQLQLVWLRPGVVYGSYRYRVAYGVDESTGISERVFLDTQDGWRIAVTSAFGAPEDTPPPPVALVGATLWNGIDTSVIEDARIVVRGGRIDCAGTEESCVIPEGVTVFDVRGRWITPGLIDTKVHFSQSGWVDTRPDVYEVHRQFPFEDAIAALQEHPEDRMRAWLQCGVTAVLDRGGFPWTWDLRNSRDTTWPFVASVGPVVTIWATLPSLAGELQTLSVQSPRDVRTALRYLGSHQTDAIVFEWYGNLADANEMKRQKELLTELARGAESRQIPLIVHSTTLNGAKIAVSVGADVVDGVADAPLDEEFLQQAQEAGVLYGCSLGAVDNRVRFARAALDKRMPRFDDPFAVIDTLTRDLLTRTPELDPSGGGVHALEQDNQKLPVHLANLRNNLRVASKSGLRIVLGTNAGSPFTLHGAAVFTEMEAMQSAGLSAVQVLEAATRNAAMVSARFEDRGTLRAGAVADLIVLDADPTTDIAHMRQQAAVMRSGELRWRQSDRRLRSDQDRPD